MTIYEEFLASSSPSRHSSMLRRRLQRPPRDGESYQTRSRIAIRTTGEERVAQSSKLLIHLRGSVEKERPLHARAGAVVLSPAHRIAQQENPSSGISRVWRWRWTGAPLAVPIAVMRIRGYNGVDVFSHRPCIIQQARRTRMDQSCPHSRSERRTRGGKVPETRAACTFKHTFNRFGT